MKMCYWFYSTLHFYILKKDEGDHIQSKNHLFSLFKQKFKASFYDTGTKTVSFLYFFILLCFLLFFCHTLNSSHVSHSSSPTRPNPELATTEFELKIQPIGSIRKVTSPNWQTRPLSVASECNFLVRVWKWVGRGVFYAGHAAFVGPKINGNGCNQSHELSRLINVLWWLLNKLLRGMAGMQCHTLIFCIL